MLREVIFSFEGLINPSLLAGITDVRSRPFVRLAMPSTTVSPRESLVTPRLSADERLMVRISSVAIKSVGNRKRSFTLPASIGKNAYSLSAARYKVGRLVNGHLHAFALLDDDAFAETDGPTSSWLSKKLGTSESGRWSVSSSSTTELGVEEKYAVIFGFRNRSAESDLAGSLEIWNISLTDDNANVGSR